ncbi:hypothetical protein [Nocardia sp. NPDC004260]
MGQQLGAAGVREVAGGDAEGSNRGRGVGRALGDGVHEAGADAAVD